MSTHEYRVRKRAERAAAKANLSPWTRMCLAAGFTEDEAGSVTVRMLHERMHGPVEGTPLTDFVR